MVRNSGTGHYQPDIGEKKCDTDKYNNYIFLQITSLPKCINCANALLMIALFCCDIIALIHHLKQLQRKQSVCEKCSAQVVKRVKIVQISTHQIFGGLTLK